MPRPAVQRGSEPGQPLRAVVRNLHAPDFFQRAVRMGGVARQFRSVAVDLIEIRAVRRNPGVGRTADHGSVEPSGGAVSWNLWACGIARDFEAAAVDVETADVAVAEVRGEHRSVVRGHLQPAQLRGHACARVDLYDRADVDVAVFFDGAQADAIADSISDDEGIRPTVQEGNVERRAAPCVVELGRAQGAGPNERERNSGRVCHAVSRASARVRAQRRLGQVDKALLSPETDGRHASLRSRAAFSLRMSGRTSSLISIFSKSDNQRSGLIIGQSEPKSTFFLRSVLQYWTRIFGKYFGDQPDRSM